MKIKLDHIRSYLFLNLDIFYSLRWDVFLLTQAAINERGVKNTDLSYKTLGLFEYENQNLRGSNIRIVYFEVEKLEVYSQNEILERLQL